MPKFGDIDPFDQSEISDERKVFQQTIGLDTPEGPTQVIVLATKDGIAIGVADAYPTHDQLVAMYQGLEEAVTSALALVATELKFTHGASIRQADGSIKMELRVAGLVPVQTTHRVRFTEDNRIVYTVGYDLQQVGDSNNFAVAVAASKLAQIALEPIIKQLGG